MTKYILGNGLLVFSVPGPQKKRISVFLAGRNFRPWTDRRGVGAARSEPGEPARLFAGGGVAAGQLRGRRRVDGLRLDRGQTKVDRQAVRGQVAG